MGLVPQSEHVPFEYSLLEYVLLGRAPYLASLEMPGEKDVEAALQALREVGMGDAYDRSVLNLSGGERQLVLLARALAQQPRMLLLDEPTSHLDLGNKSRLVRILRDLRARGITILFTTHEPDVALALANRVVLMRDGKVLQSGALDEVITSEALSVTYGLPVRVVSAGEQRFVSWND